LSQNAWRVDVRALSPMPEVDHTGVDHWVRGELHAADGA
jgi:hypothetical protein